jgi:Cu(I)/Ag(I) efflux system membrane protein CusA/SilA
MSDFRSDLQALARLPVPASDGRRQIPLAQLATIDTVKGPSMIRNEDGLLTGYVYIDLADRDPSTYVAEARRVLAGALELPPGYTLTWSGQYEGMERVRERLAVILPITFACIVLLLYANTRSVVKTLIVVLAVPFSAIGAIWFLYLLGYNMSIGVWVGLIALVGVDAETGVFMLLYLDLAYTQARDEGRLRSLDELRQAIMDGAVKRLRPKVMTVATMFIGLLPIMWAAGTGSDLMKRIAAPMIGGILTSFLLELLVYPPLYQLWKSRALPLVVDQRAQPSTAAALR